MVISMDQRRRMEPDPRLDKQAAFEIRLNLPSASHSREAKSKSTQDSSSDGDGDADGDGNQATSPIILVLPITINHHTASHNTQNSTREKLLEVILTEAAKLPIALVFYILSSAIAIIAGFVLAKLLDVWGLK